MIHFPTEEAFGGVVAEGFARDLKLFGARTGASRKSPTARRRRNYSNRMIGRD